MSTVTATSVYNLAHDFLTNKYTHSECSVETKILLLAAPTDQDHLLVLETRQLLPWFAEWGNTGWAVESRENRGLLSYISQGIYHVHRWHSFKRGSIVSRMHGITHIHTY